MCFMASRASLKKNRWLIKECDGIPPLVGLLLLEGSSLAPQIATMLLLRLAEGSTRAAVAIAEAGGILPLVKLLTIGSPATQQMAAATLSALGFISVNRNPIADANSVKPLVGLLWSTTLGTPETAARALSHLARDEAKGMDDVSDDEEPKDEMEDLEGGDATGTTPPKKRRPSVELDDNDKSDPEEDKEDRPKKGRRSKEDIRASKEEEAKAAEEKAKAEAERKAKEAEEEEENEEVRTPPLYQYAQRRECAREDARRLESEGIRQPQIGRDWRVGGGTDWHCRRNRDPAHLCRQPGRFWRAYRYAGASGRNAL